MAKSDRTASFEDLYARLEDHVARLEQGGLTLDQAIDLFEQGMNLARQCQERLDAAEQKITRLKESFAALARQPAGNGADDSTDEDYERIPEDDGADADEAFP